MFRTIIHDERGQDLVEYGLLGSFLSIAAIATLHTIGVPINQMYQQVLAKLK